MHQLEENIEAVKYIDKLTPSIMNEIEEAISNKPREDDVYKQVAAIRGARLWYKMYEYVYTNVIICAHTEYGS